MCVSTPSRNLASPETATYCYAIHRRLELLDSGGSGGSGKTLALAAPPAAGSRARESRRPAGRRTPHMPRPTQSRLCRPARRSRRRNPICGAGWCSCGPPPPVRRRSAPSARRSAVARCVERESARETQVLCEQPSCRGRPECSLYLSMDSHRHGLCEGPRVGEDPGVPLSRGCEGGPQAPTGAALRTRVAPWSTASSHRECICARSPLLCAQGMYMCSLKGPFCDVCRARGPDLGGPGGWFLCPLAMAHCRLAGGAHREVPWCAHVV